MRPARVSCHGLPGANRLDGAYVNCEVTAIQNQRQPVWRMLMRVLLFPSLFALALCTGCADPVAVQQASGCASSAGSWDAAPVSCGPTGWQNGGVVTNRNGNGPHVEIWGPPTNTSSGRD
jgi:hypothetical protein